MSPKLWGLIVLAAPILAACHSTKIDNPPAPVATYDQWGCEIPTNAVVTNDATKLEVASAEYKNITARGVKFENNPTVLPLLSEVARDAKSRGYLRCLAIKRDNFSHDEVIYLDLLNAFLERKPSPAEFIEWQKANPAPSVRRADEEEAARKKAEEETVAAQRKAQEDKVACFARELKKCLTRDVTDHGAQNYGTPKQDCDDTRTHWMRKREEKGKYLTECDQVQPHQDCVGVCYRRGEPEVERICRDDATKACP